MSDLEKTQSRSGAHSQVEDVNANILAQADAPINYDVDGIKGIVRSPYVLGAALLASFGGFSFGYGTSTPNRQNRHVKIVSNQARQIRVSYQSSWSCPSSTTNSPKRPPTTRDMASTPAS